MHSCFSAGHIYSLTRLVLEWYSSLLWTEKKVGSHGPMAHFPCEAPSLSVMSITSYAVLIKGGDVGCQLSLLEQIPEFSHHLSRPYALQALCDAMTLVFKNIPPLVCGQWKYGASCSHAKTGLWKTIHLQYELELFVMSNGSPAVIGHIANVNIWTFPLLPKKSCIIQSFLLDFALHWFPG